MAQEKYPRPPRQIVEGLSKVPSGVIADAFERLKIRGMVAGLNPAWKGARAAGPAYTVRNSPCPVSGVDPAFYRSADVVEMAEPGDVIVVDASGYQGCASLGKYYAHTAVLRGVAGMVIDGMHRDTPYIERIRFPVFSRGDVAFTGAGRLETLYINTLPVQCAGIRVKPRDVVVADEEGIAVVPSERASEVLELATKLRDRQRLIEVKFPEAKTLREALKGLPTI